MMKTLTRSILDLTRSSKNAVSIQCGRRFISSIKATNLDNALLVYGEIPNKSYLQVRGPDTIGFLNGLVTSKLLPTFVKKNLTTIEVSDEKNKKDTNNNESPEFNEKKGNWGIYNAESHNGPYLSRFGIYSAFLNGKGKLVTDSIIYPSPGVVNDQTEAKIKLYPEYLLEFDKDIIPRMLTSFESHKLHNKIKFEEVKNTKTWDFFISFPGLTQNDPNPWIDNVYVPLTYLKNAEASNEFAESFITSLFPKISNKILGFYIERRTETLLNNDGTAPQFFRIVTTEDVDNAFDAFNSEAFPFTFEKLEKDSSFFKQCKLQYGFLDGSDAIQPDSLMPLELNFDYFPNTISNNKGCYVGQELTARTYSTGILRKRLIPIEFENLSEQAVKLLNECDKYPDIEVEVDPKNQEPEPLQSTAPSPFGNSPFGNASTKLRQRKKAAGTLISFDGKYGIALFRIEHFKNIYDTPTPSKFFLTIGQEKIDVTPQRPIWYNEWKSSQ